MSRPFEIVFEKDGTAILAELLEGKAPLLCGTFWGEDQGA